MRDAGDIDGMWRDLGRQLAALRRAAGLTQVELGALSGFSRTAVSVAELGREIYSRDFWQACDKALATGGVLTDGVDQIGAVRSAVEHAAACAAQEAREARALAAFAAAREQRGVSAGVTAFQLCPNCGCEMTVLTTLIPSAASPVAHAPREAARLVQAPARAGSDMFRHGPVPAGGMVTEERRPKAIRTT